MAKKTKSYTEIAAQERRIQANLASGNYGDAWLKAIRAENAANRYKKNIKQSNKYQNTFERNADGSKKMEKWLEGFGKAVSKQYSRNTYMGLNQG